MPADDPLNDAHQRILHQQEKLRTALADLDKGVESGHDGSAAAGRQAIEQLLDALETLAAEIRSKTDGRSHPSKKAN